ncbi:MAG: hypothetical protein AUI92_05325 [Thaumarchaeota archaeon 13_1_40CM_3_38_6]|nr:MAG: hypothetical protein AUI92_05325 [Thaumarchaeota archaeon 13_1_40CM_3_38_6]
MTELKRAIKQLTLVDMITKILLFGAIGCLLAAIFSSYEGVYLFSFFMVLISFGMIVLSVLVYVFFRPILNSNLNIGKFK